jgi:radical SAM superfamily enzyme YgiQ (UPF0313 family)
VNESLRLIPRLFGEGRRSSLTIAPEVATERLRAVIGKEIDEEDLRAGVSEAYRLGWRALKLYFMVGLPTETDADVDAIAETAVRCSELRRATGGGPGRITLSVANFVPKPHTPFQWEPMAREEDLHRKRERILRGVRRRRSVKLNSHDVGRSLVEGLLARGDRRLSGLLLRLHRLGARFDAWDDRFDRARWDRALREEGLDPDPLLHREVPEEEVLPWAHLSAPVSGEYLAAERRRSREGTATGNCMDGRCRRCGIDPRDCAPALRAFREARGGEEPDAT